MFEKIKRYFTKPSPNSLIKQDTPPPTLWSGSKKLIQGAVALGIQWGIKYVVKQFSASDAQEAPAGNLERLSTSLSYALLLEGAIEIVDVAALHLYKTLDPSEKTTRTIQKIDNERTNIRREREATRTELLPLDKQRELKRYHHFLKYKNLLRSALGISITAFAAIRSIRGIKNFAPGTSLFDLSFPEGHRSNAMFSFLDAPITNIFNIVLWSLGVAYNTRELILSFNSPRPRRGDVPFFGFISAYGLVGVSAAIGNMTKPAVFGNVDIIDMTGENHEAILHLIQEMHAMSNPSQIHFLANFGNRIAAYYTYKNLLQVLYNALHLRSAVHPKSTVEIEVIPEPMALVPTLTKPASASQSQVNSVHPPQPPLYSFLEHQRAYGAQRHPPKERVIPPKTKIKTTGTPYPASATSSASASAFEKSDVAKVDADTKATGESFIVNEADREKGLEVIKRFRKLRTVSFQHINSIFGTLQSLLPNASVSHIDGSEHRLVWSWNKQHYQLKYETPHGTDSNQFSGRKLEKVLNVIEAGFLWQWDKKKREEYLSQRVGGRGLEALYYIFSERPQH